MNISEWCELPYAEELVVDGLKCLQATCLEFYKRAIQRKEQLETVQPANKPEIAKKQSIFSRLVRKDPADSSTQSRINFAVLEFKIQSEIEAFSTFLADKELMKTILSDKMFWQENKTKLPHLFTLATNYLALSSSSAYIERFFSICGIICNNRRNRMKDDLIINRGLLAANMTTVQYMHSLVKTTALHT